MALVVLDSSVIIASAYVGDRLHHWAVDALAAHNADDLVLPASVYSEILVGPLRTGPEAVAGLEAFLRGAGMRIVPVGEEIARQAAVLRAATRGLRLPDALVLATADVLEADIVLTGDATWPRLSARATAI